MYILCIALHADSSFGLSADHEYGVITLGEAQRRAIRDNGELGPKVKQALEEKVAGKPKKPGD